MRALSVVRVLGLMGSVVALFSVGCGKADDDADHEAVHREQHR